MRIDLLSDLKREVSRLYGTFLEDRFYSKRAYVLIDAAGVVRWTHEEPEIGSKRTNAELLEQVQAIA